MVEQHKFPSTVFKACCGFRLANPNEPFEAVIAMPRLVIKAKYTSSGVLIIIPASGGGDFNAVFGEFEIDSSCFFVCYEYLLIF